MSTSRIGLAAAVLAAMTAAVAIPQPAVAATVQRLLYQNGGNACTGALPTFEGALRKRPKAIANEGTSIAFVTCSLPGDDRNTARPSAAYIGFDNPTGAAISVSCTLVDGNAAYPGSGASYPQTFMVPAGSTNIQGEWNPPSPATTFATPTVAVSCALPPGLILDFFGYGIAQDVGA